MEEKTSHSSGENNGYEHNRNVKKNISFYQFTRLPEAALFQFLWDGKYSKVSKRAVCKSYQDGGLKMFDILRCDCGYGFN